MNDVDIFAACLKDLLLENDVVTVPGLGSFLTRLMPASFSDLGRTINPPYRKLSFRTAETGDASLFMAALAASLKEGTDVEAWLKSFVAGFKEALDRTKRVELAGLGALRATAQNDYFFVASEDLDIYPEGMGLEPVTIKSSTLMDYGLELKDEQQDSQADSEPITMLDPESESEPEATTVAEPESEPVVELVTEPSSEQAAEHQPAIELESEQELNVETEPEPEPEPAPAEPAPIATPALEPKPRRRIKWWAVVLIVLAALLIFLILSVIFKDRLPWGAAIDSFINHLLYSEEELRLLNS